MMDKEYVSYLIETFQQVVFRTGADYCKYEGFQERVIPNNQFLIGALWVVKLAQYELKHL